MIKAIQNILPYVNHSSRFKCAHEYRINLPTSVKVNVNELSTLTCLIAGSGRNKRGLAALEEFNKRGGRNKRGKVEEMF